MGVIQHIIAMDIANGKINEKRKFKQALVCIWFQKR
jgi:hypothetical protein